MDVFNLVFDVLALVPPQTAALAVILAPFFTALLGRFGAFPDAPRRRNLIVNAALYLVLQLIAGDAIASFLQLPVHEALALVVNAAITWLGSAGLYDAYRGVRGHFNI